MKDRSPLFPGPLSHEAPAPFAGQLETSAESQWARERSSKGSGLSRRRVPSAGDTGKRSTSRAWEKGKVDMVGSLFHTWRWGRSRPTLDDLMAPVFISPRPRLLIFLLDISDSMSEAVEHLKAALTGALGQAYFRRDPVAIVTVQGAYAALLVQPTTSLRFVLNKLSSVRVGGGTPLNKGLDLLRRMLPQWRNRYPVMDLVILSDGRSTGPMMGLQVDRALGVVRKFTREVAVVNPIPAAEPFARDLAKRLGAGYLED